MWMVGVAGVVSLGLALWLTALVREFAKRHGWVCAPRDDRWAQRSVALLGGVAIVLAFLGGIAPVMPLLTSQQAWLVGLSVLLFGIGLWDDRRPMGPHTKMLAQLLLAVPLVVVGYRFGLGDGPWRVLDIALTIVWLVGLSNAVNLLDNMDGLCAGVVCIAALFQTVLFCLGDNPVPAALTLALAGACLGYLYHNWHPASIFMGDCGSLPMGLVMAGLALLPATEGRSSHLDRFGLLVVPILVLLVPVVDTTVVATCRALAGRSPLLGGKDHLSHRLVIAGLTEPRAVQMHFLLGAISGGTALAVCQLAWYHSTVILPALLFAVAAVGCFLGRVPVYGEMEPLSVRLSHTHLRFLANERRSRVLVQMAVDALAVAASFYAAAALRYEEQLAVASTWSAVLRALPVVLLAHMVALAATGVYRGTWRYCTVSDLLRFVKAATFGMALSAAALAALGWLSSLSASLLTVNWLVQLCFLTGPRITIRLLADRLQVVGAGHEPSKRVLAVGLGDEAELTLRRLRRQAGLRVVGAICEEESAVGLELLETPVLGTSRDLADLLRELNVHRVVLIDPHYPEDGWRRIVETCTKRNVETQVARHLAEKH